MRHRSGRGLVPRRSTIVAVLVVALLVLGGGVFGLYRWVTAAPQAAHCPAAVEAVAASAGEDDASRLILLIDQYSNGAKYAGQVAAAVRSVFVETLAQGASVSLTVDPGGNSAFIPSRCLDGSRTFRVDFENQDRSEQDTTAAGDAVERHVFSLLRNARVRQTGSPIRLLRHAAVEVGAQTSAIETDAYVWTDFLSNAGDCLDPQGFRATTRTIRALVRRCSATTSLERVRASLHVIGFGSTRRPFELEQWGRELAQAICSRTAASCSVE
jgi:hypothetical protein